MNKLKNSRGETLVETLAAIVIITLAVMLMAYMIGASGRITISARNASDDLYAQLDAAELGGGTGEYTVSAVCDGETISIPVNVTGTDGQLMSYRLLEEGEG